jgi:hypothetical protein
VAPTYFKRVTIDPEGEEEEFLDGGMGYNNLVKQVLDEAQRIFPAGRRIGCIVSIGTGQANVTRYDSPNAFGKFIPIELVKALQEMGTDSDKTAKEMENRFKDVPDTYFRFSVDRGLDGISLEEWQKLAEVATYTNSYTALSEVSARIDKVVTSLLASRRFISGSGGVVVQISTQTSKPLTLPWPSEKFIPDFNFSVGHLSRT